MKKFHFPNVFMVSSTKKLRNKLTVFEIEKLNNEMMSRRSRSREMYSPI